MIVADTNTVSEFMRDEPDPRVMAWARSIPPADLTICVVTVEEIERGLGRLTRGRRRHGLEHRWAALLTVWADAVVSYDLPAAQQTADVLVAAEKAGRPTSLADAQIAGICLANGFGLATRNVDDFAVASGLEVVNPFEQ